jgi:predicted SAM-dependent methyltransferase
MKDRTSCVLCEGSLSPLFSFDMPSFMGVNLDDREEAFNKMTFLECTNCGEVQIKELIDLEVLYQNNHNIGVVGKMWEYHYKSFSKFISKGIINKTVLEISDPSAKIASQLTGYKSWSIVEPNPDEVSTPNVLFIKSFFDEHFHLEQKVDIIVHSHLLEHIHNPYSFFKQCNSILVDDGVMYVSVPDMDYLLNQTMSPNAILHFEHTYFINKEVINYLASKTGFEIIKTEKYNDHSVFYELKKVSSNLTNLPILDLKQKFLLSKSLHKKKIENINEKLSQYENLDVYLFGAHVSSQYYISNGLNVDRIKSLLDNSINKQNHRLYGTSLFVQSPDILIHEGPCVVICSHMSVYLVEISNQLLRLNKNIKIL